MNTRRYSFTAAILCGLAAVAASGVFSLRSGRSVEFATPPLPDSTSRADHPFDKGRLLESMPPLSRMQAAAMTADFTTVLPDTAGRFALVAPSDESKLVMQRFETSLRPHGYFKGKLKISSNAAAKAYMNGKEILSKATFDSVPADAEGSFTLEPWEDALFEIRTLTDTVASSPTLKVEFLPEDDSKEVELDLQPGQPTRFNVNTIAEGGRLTAATLSPDGKYMILTNSFSHNSIDTHWDLSVASVPGNETIFVDPAKDARWLPGKGSTIYYTKSNGNDTFDLLTLEFPSLKRGVMASGLPKDAKDFIMSPQADYILYYVEEEGEKDDTGVMHRLQSPDDRQPSHRNRYYISMINLKDGVSRPLTYGGNSTILNDISPDGKRILYSSSRETPEKFPFYETSLIQMDLQSMTTDTIPGVDSSLQNAIYSPDGNRIFILDGPNAFDGAGRNAGSFDWANDFDIQGFIYDFKTGKVSPMTRDFNPNIQGAPVWVKGDNRIYFMGEDGFDRNLFRLDPSSGKIEKLPAEIDYIRDFSVADNNAAYLAYTGMSYTYMGRGYLMNLKNEKSTLIADPMADALKNLKFGEYEFWNFTSPDGTVVEGTMTLPPDFDPTKKYPLIVYYYGGTSPSSRVNHHPYTPQIFASRGYVVYVLNPSGTTGYGQEYSARHVNAWGDRTADEIIYGVKEFCRQHPFVDASKIGCLGASYGGFMTQLLQTKTDIFAAAVSHAGISNITSYWGEGWWGYSYNSVAAARSYPWNNPRLFTENSPLFHADKIHTPLLLLHGSVDTNVPIGESIQLYNALKILGRDVEFITVDGADHVVVDFEKRKEWHATIMAWFEKWLKGDARWWDSIYNK